MEKSNKRGWHQFLTELLDREQEQYGQEDPEGYFRLAVMYLCIHVFLEIFYISVGCTPMAKVNIISTALYVVVCIMCKTGHEYPAIWITMWEVYLHCVLASILLGYACGFQVWLFALVLADVIPYFTPVNNRTQRIITYSAICLNIITYFVLAGMDFYGLAYRKYYPSIALAHGMFVVNSLVVFLFILFYMTLSSVRTETYNRILKRLPAPTI